MKLAAFIDESCLRFNRPTSLDYPDELVAACQRAGFRQILDTMRIHTSPRRPWAAYGLDVTLVQVSSVNLNVHSVVFKELTTRADLAELALLGRSHIADPLVEHFVAYARVHAGYEPPGNSLLSSLRIMQPVFGELTIISGH